MGQCPERERAGQTEGETAAQQKKKKERAMAGNGKSKVPNSGLGSGYHYDSKDDMEILRWKDIAEDLGYPHPDAGYDPWSD